MTSERVPIHVHSRRLSLTSVQCLGAPNLSVFTKSTFEIVPEDVLETYKKGDEKVRIYVDKVWNHRKEFEK